MRNTSQVASDALLNVRLFLTALPGQSFGRHGGDLHDSAYYVAPCGGEVTLTVKADVEQQLGTHRCWESPQRIGSGPVAAAVAVLSVEHEATMGLMLGGSGTDEPHCCEMGAEVAPSLAWLAWPSLGPL